MRFCFKYFMCKSPIGNLSLKCLVEFHKTHFAFFFALFILLTETGHSFKLLHCCCYYYYYAALFKTICHELYHLF